MEDYKHSSLTNLQIRRISSEEERMQVYEEAKKDGHSALMPTHIVKKGGDIVGAFCLFSPTVYWWMHTTKVRGRDSLSIFQTMSALLTNEGVTNSILPCQPESPYFHLLSNKLQTLGDWKLFINKG